MSRTERKKYHAQIEMLLGFLKDKSLSPEDAEKVNTIAEDHSWDGLSCCCGGGWLVGHPSDCPEKEGDE